ncbi:oxygen-independent coproporphyrinogen-3 oxidase [Alteribacillus persepolensis]|uniref:Oxygen-independent coproporphyrinogen-3 oxidase n=1 Tax=Alteribacillus persepolensis TaxID=568899 RepID=A0A1G8DCX1_9BACI|nr:coproporphyrinogen III oxidase [Alteribacillus persepolensis]SDH55557.1 oxygen-independent coproporphyrinogen-3 oxidase [Alteribacillus persepolensis]
MMIKIQGVEEKDLRPLQHIIDMYNMHAQLKISPETAEEAVIAFTETEIRDYIEVKAVFSSNDAEVLKESFQKHAPRDLADKEKRKRAKQARSHVLVKLLNTWTKTVQPWGTLTGIRPTKLWHSLYRDGMELESIQTYLQNDYLVTPEKTALLEEIGLRQHHVLPDLYDLANGVSIYIGIPFCPTKCAYCTFPAYAINGKNGSVETFLEGLHIEMEQIGNWLRKTGVPVTTIYFGGGTPTSITADEMDALYAKMYEVIPGIHHVREITVEAGRPDTITPEKLEVLSKWSIDRISINPQSFDNQTLKAIGRHHSVEETKEKYDLSRKMGMKNINMDLIIGLPGEGEKEMQHSLNETEQLLPESVTVHTLSFKRASTMTKQKDKYKVAEPDEIEKMMKQTADWMKTHDYHPYYLYRQKNILGNLENVGYSFEGKESLYNIIIMEEVQSIIGLGCGAASKWVHPQTKKISRFANPKDPVTYNNHYEEYTHKKITALDELFNNQSGIKAGTKV